ncbi:hypothetical Protein pso3_02490 [Candidatus Phytoplasma solani]
MFLIPLFFIPKILKKKQATPKKDSNKWRVNHKGEVSEF